MYGLMRTDDTTCSRFFEPNSEVLFTRLCSLMSISMVAYQLKWVMLYDCVDVSRGSDFS